MAVIRDTFESQYFIQDKEGNVWGEIKPIDIKMEQNSGELPEIELTGYLSFDVDKVKRINETKIKIDRVDTATINELAYQPVSTTKSCAEWWNEHCRKSWIISENDKGGDEMKILEIYEKRKADKLWAELKEAKEKIIKADEITKRVAEFKEKLEEDYKMYVGVDLSIGTLTKESEEEIAKAEHEHDVEIQALKERVKEIRAQLEICENYEQKIDILVAYEIINKKTKQILA